MQLEIIVVSVDKPHLVRRLFDSLSDQTCKDFSVLFVYGQGIAKEVVTELCNSFSNLSITPLPSTDCCLSRSRNLALAEVKEDVVAIADDDCAYEPDVVAHVLATFKEHEDIDILMGSTFGFGEAVPPGVTYPISIDRYGLFKACPSYVHFYRASVVKAVGCFDEELGVGSSTPYQSGEETDFVLRALDADFSIARVSSIVIRHPAVSMRNKNLLRKTANYAAGRIRLLRKHNFPRWFMLANVLYPLLALPRDCFVESGRIARYRWAMFIARLKWWIKLR